MSLNHMQKKQVGQLVEAFFIIPYKWHPISKNS